jgi:hypothetical protein
MHSTETKAKTPIETNISEGTLRHTFGMEPPKLDEYGRCADCGYEGEFLYSPEAHYSGCEWAFAPPAPSSAGFRGHIRRLLEQGKTPAQISGGNSYLLRKADEIAQTI